MFVRSQKLSSMLKIIYQFTAKSRRQNTPKLFKNPRLTPRGLLQKKSKSYDYQLPESLPNRQLYWDKKKMNQIYRERYAAERLRKLKIRPIHNQKGQRTFQRQLPQIIAEMTSLRLIKSSSNRTMANLYEAVTRFREQFVGQRKGKQIIRGNSFDILAYTFKEVHDRHMASMNFYLFSTFCQLRFMSYVQPTPEILCHFFKHLQGFKQDNNKSEISIQRMANLANYIFSRKYPQQYNQVLFKNEQTNFNLFEDTQPDNKSFQHIMPDFYTQQQLQKQSESLKKLPQKKRSILIKSIKRIPGGQKLANRVQNCL